MLRWKGRAWNRPTPDRPIRRATADSPRVPPHSCRRYCIYRMPKSPRCRTGRSTSGGCPPLRRCAPYRAGISTNCSGCPPSSPWNGPSVRFRRAPHKPLSYTLPPSPGKRRPTPLRGARHTKIRLSYYTCFFGYILFHAHFTPKASAQSAAEPPQAPEHPLIAMNHSHAPTHRT